MALPKINELPSYELVIPSSQQKIEYRPFLVKEQKILMMALETQDEKAILKAIVDTIESCVTTKMDVQALATFDIEYLFTQIRAKSVGEKATVNLKCGKCEQDTQVEIPLDKVNKEYLVIMNIHFQGSAKVLMNEGLKNSINY